MNYDFSVLSDYEFEKLVNKLLTNKGVVVEQYRIGKDQGYDGFTKVIPGNAIVQAKHYTKSSFATLKRKIEIDELPKIHRENPSAYVLATSYNLTHLESAKLKALIETEVLDVTILGYESISSLLDNDKNTLKSMVKLWCGSAEIAKHVLNPELMSRFIQLNSRINDKRKIFVETPDVKHVLDQLRENHTVVIAGEPGVGKTTLAEYLCYWYLGNDYDVQIFEGDFSREKYDLSNREEKKLYYFDDFLGSNYYNCMFDKSDSAIVKFIEQIQKEPNKRFILTSRTHIVNRAQEYSQSYRSIKLSKKQYIVNVGNFDDLTKAKILYNHLKFSDLDSCCLKEFIESKEYLKIIQHKNFNPRLIEFISRKENFEDCSDSYLSFVRNAIDNPKEIWENCFTAQLNEYQRLFIKLVVVNGGSVQEEDLKPAYRKAIQTFSIQKPEQERVDYEYVLKVCERCMLKRSIQFYFIPHKVERAVISVFNPSVSDYLLPIILSNLDELEMLCDSLRTVESLIILSKFQENENRKIMKRLLSKYTEDEWPLARLMMISFLEDKELAQKVYKAINGGLIEITADNWNCLQAIIIFSVNECDWSNILLNLDKKVYNSLEDYDVLYDSYKNCKYSQNQVLTKLHDNIVAVLKSCIDNKILERFDCDREIDKDDVWNEYAEYTVTLVDKLPFLSEDDCDTIAEGLNVQWIIDEVESSIRQSQSDEYCDDEIQPSHNVDDEINKMFLGLLD